MSSLGTHTCSPSVMGRRRLACATSVVAFCASLLTPIPAESGALPRKAGSGYFLAELSGYRTSSFWDIDGDSRSLRSDFSKQELSFYGEYGLTDQTTLTYRLSQTELQQRPFTNSGPGAPEVGLVHNVWRDETRAASVYAKLVLPNSQSIVNQFPAIDYDQSALELGLLYGEYRRNSYIDSGIGVRAYQGFPSDQLRGYLRFGVHLSGQTTVWGQLDATLGLDRGARGPLLSPSLPES